MYKPIPQNKTSSLSILFVDDESMLTKWFKKTFEADFNIVCANSVDEALVIINSPNHDIAVVVTDFQMPGRNGLELLQRLSVSHPTITKILVSAYADKGLILNAVNNQLVFRVLEKPLDILILRKALKLAQQFHLDQVTLKGSVENGLRGMRESLGFLAHELNSPLTIIATYLSMLSEEVDSSSSNTKNQSAVINAAQRSIKFCQNLVNSFTQSSRSAYSISETKPVSALTLIQLLIREFPFSANQRDWIEITTKKNFALPSSNNLIFLCLSTILQNALRELEHSGESNPHIQIALGEDADSDITRKDKFWISITDNGSGIPSSVASQLLNKPVTSYEGKGGNGMGLMFCKKVMLSLAGNITIETRHADIGYKPGATGTTVTLHFPGNEAPENN